MTAAGLAAALLDDDEQLAAVDPEGALADVEACAEQWREAADFAGARANLDGANAIVVLGMGGSGISGDVVTALAAPRLRIPVVVHKGYGLPAFVGRDTLVVAVSYSGDTEETLSGVDEALERGARLFAVSSGGALTDLAHGAGAPSVRVPGAGMPRHSLGYLLVPLLIGLGLDEGLDEAIDVLDATVANWGRSVPTAGNPGKQLAARLRDGTVPFCYGAQGVPAVAALRLKCQFNENAKLPAVWAAVPELCHNEIVGWEGDSRLNGRAALLWLRDPAGEHPRNAARVELLEDLTSDRVAWTATLEAVGESPLARAASLIAKADLLSVYTALVREVDPTPIASIAALKDALAGRGGAAG